MNTWVWLNDEIVESHSANVNVFDHGLTVADGIFETLKIADGQVFAFDRHVDRLQRSADILGLGMIDRDAIAKGVAEVLAANAGLTTGRMRITLTSGVGPLGSDRLDSPHTLVIAASATKLWPEETSVVIVPWIRNERSAIAGAKSTSYAENVVALQAAHDAGFSEAVFTDSRGHISEGTGTNIFMVNAGMIHTPAIDTGLLQGITRNLVIEWAQGAELGVAEDHFSVADLLEADEVFITSSTRDVHPVTSLGVMAPDKAVVTRVNKSRGSVTTQLQKLFAENARKNVNP